MTKAKKGPFQEGDASCSSPSCDNMKRWFEELVLATHVSPSGARLFRLHTLSAGAEGSVGWDALQQQGLLYESDAWQHAVHTEAISSDIFIANALAAGATYCNVVLKFSTFPFKLAELIRPTADLELEALALLTARECSLDAFSSELRKRFPTVTALSSPSCLNMVRAMMSFYDVTTFSTERLHSKNSRRILSRRQTHQLSLHHLGIFHTGSGTPSPFMPLLPAPVQAVPGFRVGDNRRVRKPKRKRGGGGPWRAFVHLQSQQWSRAGISKSSTCLKHIAVCLWSSERCVKPLAKKAPSCTSVVRRPSQRLMPEHGERETLSVIAVPAPQVHRKSSSTQVALASCGPN